MSSFFGPGGKLSVVWTRIVMEVPGTASLEGDTHFAKQI